MTFIRVTPAALAQGAGDINTYVTDLRTQVADLASYLLTALGSWEGDALDSYTIAKGQWDAAVENIATILGTLKDGVIDSNEMYQITEIRNANRFAV
jgi:WXG100 family type VII secretion target